MRKCIALTKAGSPCQTSALTGSDKCIYHDNSPNGIEIRADGNRAAARSRHAYLQLKKQSAQLRTPDEIANWKTEIAIQLREGSIDPDTARSALWAANQV